MKKNIIKFMVTTTLLTSLMGTTVFATDFDRVLNDVYEVKVGDTLWKISQKYETKLENIIDANPQIQNPDLIYPGDKVSVPTSSELYENGETDIGASMCDDGSGSVTGNPRIQAGSKSNVQSKNASSKYETQVADLVNKERAKQGLKPLKLSADVSNVARIKSEDMMNKKYFDHNSPTYGSPFDMMKEFGIAYKTAGENIAKGQKTPEQVMNAWMNSSGHKKNIMNPNFNEIGVGYVSGGGTTYWTQQFVTR